MNSPNSSITPELESLHCQRWVCNRCSPLWVSSSLPTEWAGRWANTNSPQGQAAQTAPYALKSDESYPGRYIPTSLSRGFWSSYTMSKFQDREGAVWNKCEKEMVERCTCFSTKKCIWQKTVNFSVWSAMNYCWLIWDIAGLNEGGLR